jgi:hypothetical protein
MSMRTSLVLILGLAAPAGVTAQDAGALTAAVMVNSSFSRLVVPAGGG